MESRSVRTPRMRGSGQVLGIAGLFVASVAFGSAAARNQGEVFLDAPPQSDAQARLVRHCGACHGAETHKGEVRFDVLDALPVEEQVALLSAAQEALHFEEMPPPAAPQPEGPERDALVTAVRLALAGSGDEGLAEKLRQPHYGNLVDHDLLFGSGAAAEEPPSTPARRWLVSPQIFRERVMDVFELTGWERARIARQGFYGVTNPFVLPDHSGVRDYDIGTLDGAHLLTMLSNARWIAGKQVLAARHQGENRRDIVFENPKDRWLPPGAPEEFRAVLAAEGTAGDEILAAAVRRQFELVLRRQPDGAELEARVALGRALCASGGNGEGLERLLMSVLLEADFLYRTEFGAGEPDPFGRVPLGPREAAFAIGYALGDRGPDEALLRAADEGRLATESDYRREVERLLADPDHYRGAVDPVLDGKNFRSNETSHPRLVRFFREFFGYPAAVKVFKDPPRSDHYYTNPHRGTMATPGRLVLEADRFVTLHVERDRDVFRELLTSDRWFVYQDRDNESGTEILAQWRGVWETLGDTDWRDDPLGVLEEHADYIASKEHIKLRDNRRGADFGRYMWYFAESFGRGRRPFTTVPWQHGYHFSHSTFYGLPPTPGAFRYTKGTNDRVAAPDPWPEEFWDYEPVQPFPVPHRRGILTHPAWLVAHSTNFDTDPIRRGRWVREKLLAGRVPDVPITVDAQVPDDPHMTLRQRVESVTTAEECWRCHQHMNPLGMPFEVYDDFGRYRREEPLEHPDNLREERRGRTVLLRYPLRPVDPSGELDGSGDPELDGPVEDAFDLVDRLARSERVRQSMVRHAFRFFLGRNERLADAPTLRAADRAYVESGGSFRALVTALLTSESFRYRKQPSH